MNRQSLCAPHLISRKLAKDISIIFHGMITLGGSREYSRTL